MSAPDYSITAIIPAAGLGKRMRSQEPKQFLTIDDEPILTITVKALAESGLIRRFVVPTNDVVHAKKILKSYADKVETFVVKGGKTRQESVHNGLNLIRDFEDRSDFVLIHDAVRALVTKEIIQNVVDKAIETGAAVAAMPVSDTLKHAYLDANNNQLIKKNIPREHMWMTQTPQVFKADMLIKAYDQAKKDHYLGTDSAGLVERAGEKVFLVETPKTNLKITTPEDLEFAKFFLSKTH